MKNGHLVSLALAVPALLVVGCGGGSAGVGSMNSMAAGTSGGDTSGTAGSSAGSTGGDTSGGAGASPTTGAAGSTTTTGAAGSAASAAADCTMDPGTTDDTISDFEDGTGSVLPNGGRNGGWYSYIDTAPTCMVMPAPNGTATAAEIPGGRCQSMFAMHFSGMGCSVFGAGVGTDLAAPASTDAGATTGSAAKTPYDVSMYSGISFWVRADKGSSIRFKMPMTDDTKTTDGGNCVDSATSKCSDDFGSNIALTKNWVKKTVMFSKMTQEGWGKKFTWTPAHVTSIQFQVPVVAAFDVWIDDVSFVK
ncbi:MAG TPA: hypothetical protein VHL80_02590 [Polyangia bacterium]|nr:hypothetical protein [Polyangia bacterium]